MASEEKRNLDSSPSPRKFSIIKKVFYFLGMVFFLILGLYLFALFADPVIRMHVMPGLLPLGMFCSLYTAMVLGYSLFFPIGRRGKFAKRAIKFSKFTLWLALALTLIIPQFLSFTQTRDRTPDAEAKANIHNLYLACKGFWMDNGSEKSCDSKNPDLKRYGFILSENVFIQSSGTKKDFHATAKHNQGAVSYSMNAYGRIAMKN